MATTFDADLDFSRSLEPAQDRILRCVFGDTSKIIRYGPDFEFRLDKRYHIDLAVDTGYGTYTLQSKSLRNYTKKYGNNLTVEYMSNISEDIEGEFFHLYAHLFFSGRANEDETDYETWHIIRCIDFVSWIRKKIKNQEFLPIREVKNGNASFLYYPFDSLPREMIYASSDD